MNKKKLFLALGIFSILATSFYFVFNFSLAKGIELLGQKDVLPINTYGQVKALSNASTTFANALMPTTDNKYDMGTSTTRWRNGYFVNLFGNGSGLTGVSGGSAQFSNTSSLYTGYSSSTFTAADLVATSTFVMNRTATKTSGTFYVGQDGGLSTSGTITQNIADANAFSVKGTSNRRAFLVDSSDSVNPAVTIGEDGTGVTGGSFLYFKTNVRSTHIRMENALGNALIYSAGGGHLFIGPVLPYADVTYDLGNPAPYRWKDFYMSGTANIGTNMLLGTQGTVDATSTIYHGLELGNRTGYNRGVFNVDTNGNVNASGTMIVGNMNVLGTCTNCGSGASGQFSNTSSLYAGYSSSTFTAAVLNATSTSVSSTFSGGLIASQLNINGTAGSSTFANGIRLTGGCFLDASGTCLTAGGGGANTALSNLASVAINTSLLSNSDGTLDFGSQTNRWRNGYFSGNVNASGTLVGANLNILAGGTVTLPSASISDSALSSNVALLNRASQNFTNLNLFTGGVNVSSTILIDNSLAINKTNTNASGTFYIDSSGNTYSSGTLIFTGGTTSTISQGINLATTAGNVGIGTTAPGSKLSVSKNTATVPASTLAGQTIAQFTAADANTATRVLIDGYATIALLDFRRANNTAASPSALLLNQQIGGITWSGYEATAHATSSKAAISGFASENWTDGAQGVYLAFNTTQSGKTAAVERMRLDNVGNLGIGTAGPSSRLTVGFGGVDIGSGVATTTVSSTYFIVNKTTTNASGTFYIDPNGNVNGSGTITSFGHSLPGINNTYDLGSIAKAWRNLFISNNASVSGTLAVGTSGTTNVTSTFYNPINVNALAIGNQRIAPSSTLRTFNLGFPSGAVTGTLTLNWAKNSTSDCIPNEIVMNSTSTWAGAYPTIIDFEKNTKGGTYGTFNSAFATAANRPELQASGNSSSSLTGFASTSTILQGETLRGKIIQWGGHDGLDLQVICRVQ